MMNCILKIGIAISCIALGKTYSFYNANDFDFENVYWAHSWLLPQLLTPAPLTPKAIAATIARMTTTTTTTQELPMNFNTSPVKCRGVFSIPNGYVFDIEKNWIGSRHVVLCNPGFTRKGAQYVECLSNGQWRDEGVCEAIACVWPRPEMQDLLVFFDGRHGNNSIQTNAINFEPAMNGCYGRRVRF